MDPHKTNISVVSYLNARPFLFGMKHILEENEFLIETDIPSICAQKLKLNQTDIGLIPVAMISSLKEAHLITSYGIFADGGVDSVVLVSNSPIQEINTIHLDKESRTSVLLARILAKELWGIQPLWIPELEEDHLLNLNRNEGAVIIGDRALRHKSNYNYCYDLAAGWKKLTGLPFVFAAWVSNKKISNHQLEKLENSFEYGTKNLSSIYPILEKEYPGIDIKTYLEERIKYKLDEAAHLGLRLFLEKIK